MAGSIPTTGKKLSPDVLFDLTPEDDVHLSEHDLLQFVNQGQYQKTIDILGTDGRVNKIELALLWEADHLDIFQRTSAAASDPILRVRLLRRLKLHKAIQKINDINYADKDDPSMQRKLWTVLSKLSDVQMEYLDNQYSKIEMERNMIFLDVIKGISQEMTNTIPPDLKAKVKKEETGIDPHLDLMQKTAKKNQDNNQEIKSAIVELVGETIQEGETPKISSPKQGA